jgi:hypothetical protein
MIASLIPPVKIAPMDRVMFGPHRPSETIWPASKTSSLCAGFCRNKVAADRVGTNVFIGHGRAAAWRELKDFVQDRLGRPWDEFNRVPVAGITNIAQLSEMLELQVDDDKTARRPLLVAWWRRMPEGSATL